MGRARLVTPMNKRNLVVAIALLIAAAVLVPGVVGEDQTPLVYRTGIDGMIHDGITAKLEMAIEQAVAGRADALVIVMDTPGGVLDSTRDIVQQILNAPLPIFVYVAPSGAHAGSAGVMVTLASHVAAMAPGTNIGAATPVSPQGEIPETMKKKVTNDTAAFVEAIAEQRKRNTEWAIKAVRDAESVTDSKALELGVIDIVAQDLSDLFAQADGRTVDVAGTERVLAVKGATVVDVKLGWKQKALIGFANPSLAFAFMILAVLGLYVEFSNPGMIVPGAVGVLCGILFLFSIQVLPFNFLGLFVIALGIACFALEMKFTSYGLLTICGIAGLAGGSLLLFDVPSEMFDPRTAKEFRVPMGIVLPVTITLGLFIALVMYSVVRAHRGRVISAQEGMVGEIGIVKRPPEGHTPGQVFLHGEIWQTECEEPLAPGDRVTVLSSRGLTLRVAKVD